MGVKILADPIRAADYSRYRGVHCMTPNRLEAQLATGLTIARPEDALRVGRRLVESLEMEAVLVTLDRDGMALVRADGRAELLPTRPRQVYDITGAGDMVLAVVGICLAGGADYDEAAELGNVAGGLEVEQFGVALLTREEILRDLVEHHRPEGSKLLGREQLVAEVRRRRRAGETIVFTNGCFDLLHPGPRPIVTPGRDAGGLPGRRPELGRERPAAERPESPDPHRGRACRDPDGAWRPSGPCPSSTRTRRWS